MIYTPAEDSYLLLKHVKEYAEGKTVLDMGTGSGVLAEEAKKWAVSVLAVDCNEEAVAVVKAKGIRVLYSDLFSRVGEKFDVVFFNPPYLPYDEQEDEDTRLMTTGGKRGSELLERFLKEAKEYLNPSGKVVILFSSLTPDLEVILRKYNYKFKKIDECDLFFEKLFVYEAE